jgi:hypothetical protein
LADEKEWRILVGDETYSAVRSRKENTPCAKIPHQLLKFEMKSGYQSMSWCVVGRAHPHCPIGWWEIMDLVQTLDARLQAELSPEAYAQAQARGREMDVQQTTISLLAQLKEMAASIGAS